MSGKELNGELTENRLDETATGLDSDRSLTQDEVFHMMQCRRRRLVLKYLQEYEGESPARMEDIAEHIAALEHDTTVDALTSQQRKRVYVGLYQLHLPKMDETGVIDYNQDRGYVEPTEVTDQFDSYLDNEPSLLNGDDPKADLSSVDVRTEVGSTTLPDVGGARWYKRYLYASAVSFLMAVGTASEQTSAFPSGVGLSILVSGLFVLLAVSHWLTETSQRESLLAGFLARFGP